METKTPEQAMVERIADRKAKALRELRALELREVAAGRDPADSRECEEELSLLVSWVEETLPGLDDLDADTFLEDLVGQAVERVCGPMPKADQPADDQEAARVAALIGSAADAGMAQDMYLHARQLYRARGKSMPPIVVAVMRARFEADRIQSLHRAACAADDAFAEALRSEYGKEAGDARYLPTEELAEWIRPLAEKKVRADKALRVAQGGE